MSADNFNVVWKDPGSGYRVTIEFASDEEPWELMRLMPRGKWFATLDEASRYANEEYSEYGVVYQFDVHVSEEPA